MLFIVIVQFWSFSGLLLLSVEIAEKSWFEYSSKIQNIEKSHEYRNIPRSEQSISRVFKYFDVFLRQNELAKQFMNAEIVQLEGVRNAFRGSAEA